MSIELLEKEELNQELFSKSEEEKSPSNTYTIKQPAFEGPFDLLLYLIDDDKLDLFDLSLSALTDEYVEYLEHLPKWDLESISETVVLISYLMEQKSKKLLPKKEEAIEEDILPKLEENLVDRIVEYKVFKDLARILDDRKKVFQKVYPRFVLIPEDKEKKKNVVFKDISARDLVVAFKKVYDDAKQRERASHIIEEEYTVEDKMYFLTAKLRSNKEGVSFFDLFETSSRLEIVVTFLALLELIKQQSVLIRQGSVFGEIMIYSSEKE